MGALRTAINHHRGGAAVQATVNSDMPIYELNWKGSEIYIAALRRWIFCVYSTGHDRQE
ncbi:hypothetical protein LT85_3973 [Collimonas arenae]|uniref:Uncharacterized protein n=1 Tax=Collimonas arenae TaxID=279058 RepID=A0A0A1FF33_9BURK|nr:hypothetical protein LT85_3973 [Collimonas arenae]